MYNWKNRAKKVGVELLPAGSPTKATIETWKQEIRDKERGE